VFAEIERRNRSRWGDQMTPERARALARPTPERTALKQRLRAQLEAPELGVPARTGRGSSPHACGRARSGRVSTDLT